MREILFRGKRIDTGEWVYGWPFADTADCSLKKNGKCICQHDGSEFFIVEWVDIYHEYEERKVTPETVGQFTGLLDKNGKRIFEGDIVRLYFIDAEEVGEIVWDEERYRVAYFSPDGDIYGVDGTVEIEIIGNIHDNPELLEVSKND